MATHDKEPIAGALYTLLNVFGNVYADDIRLMLVLSVDNRRYAYLLHIPEFKPIIGHSDVMHWEPHRWQRLSALAKG